VGVRWGDIALFKGLCQTDLEQVRPIFDQRTLPPGTPVITEGETGQEMFVLVRGKVRIVKAMLLPGLNVPLLDLKDPRKVLAELTGDCLPFFGEMGLLSDAPRSATVETVEQSDFLVTDRERFFALVQACPVLGCALLAALGERMADMVRTSNDEVVKLTTALALVLTGRR